MKRQIILFIAIVILFANGAFAGRTWFYNQVTDSEGIPIGGFSSTAIGMRSGGTWPVVAYTNGVNNGVGVMLPGSWTHSTGGLDGLYIDGATAPDGTVAFADDQGNIKMLSPYGFSSASYAGEVQDYRPSVAFNSDSTPAVLHNDYGGDQLYITMKSGPLWHTTAVMDGAVPVSSDRFALDFDSYNQANIAFTQSNRLAYGTKGVTTGGQWQFSDPLNGPVVLGELDMTIASDDVPYVAYSDIGSLMGGVYDVHSDSWMTNLIDTLAADNFSIAADSTGGVGIAYVADVTGDEMLSFVYNDGITGWSAPERLILANEYCSVGLVFDSENNPVISYLDEMGGLYIAYDPVVVPEPATLALFTLALGLIRRRSH
ncbi:MAG: PEP-CTERM sorting domain-containing protein [Sedimentisphaerales bacterium]|nr:PEP-CTERM sorting domain-containing protein [Sedimentisphaerales bacterium]